MMNKMPCEKKNHQSLIESLKSTKDHIDDTIVRSGLLSNVVVVLVFVLWPAFVVYYFWLSVPISHTSESTEKSTVSSESFMQNSKYNHIKIDRGLFIGCR